MLTFLSNCTLITIPSSGFSIFSISDAFGSSSLDLIHSGKSGNVIPKPSLFCFHPLSLNYSHYTIHISIFEEILSIIFTFQNVPMLFHVFYSLVPDNILFLPLPLPTSFLEGNASLTSLLRPYRPFFLFFPLSPF